MKKFGLLFGFLLTGVVVMFGQGAKNIRINEVLINNTASYQDEYGQCIAWIELENTSFSTYDVRNMYLTTDKSVINPNMSVPERVKRMCVIPSEDPRTCLTARQHLILFCNSEPQKGSFHLALKLDPKRSNWIALYDGNASNVIDSVTIPVMASNCSYARIDKGEGNNRTSYWVVNEPKNVTPGIVNQENKAGSKSDKIKQQDPNGIGLSIIAMAIVFFCLALMYAFFRLLGIVVTYEGKVGRVKAIKKISDASHKMTVMAKEGYPGKGIDKEIYIAVISMALKEYEEDVHDVESNVITIKPHISGWNAKGNQMTETPKF